MLRQIRIFCLAKIIRKLYEHACGLFFSRHYSATLWYDVKESFLFRERADALFIGKLLEYYIFLNEVWKIGAQHSMQTLLECTCSARNIIPTPLHYTAAIDSSSQWHVLMRFWLMFIYKFKIFWLPKLQVLLVIAAIN